MKIVLVDPSLFTWPYDVELAKALQSAGHEVVIFGRTPAADESLPADHFLVPHFYRGLDASLAARLPAVGYASIKALSHVESMFRMLRRLNQVKPEIIHFQWTPLAMVDGRFIPACRHIAPTLLTAHDSAPFNDNPRSRLQRIGATKIMRHFDGVIVHTEAARARVARYGVVTDRIDVIPHGLLLDDNTAHRRSGDRNRLSRDGQDHDAVTLLLFGKIKPYKGTDVLLRAVAALPDDLRRRCRVVVAGKPYMNMEPLMTTVSALGLNGQVSFDLRYIPDEEIAEIFAQADIHVFPYREIDASGVLMAAIATGQVIVASRIGLFAEMLEDSRSAALVPPNDPAALAKALAPLIADRARREAMRREVIALRGRIPTWDAIAARTVGAYHRAAETRLTGSATVLGDADAGA